LTRIQLLICWSNAEFSKWKYYYKVLNLATYKIRLGCRERVEFEREFGDVKWLAAKRDRPVKKPRGRKMELSVAQAGYYARIKE
jgi:hypothetical protein